MLSSMAMRHLTHCCSIPSWLVMILYGLLNTLSIIKYCQPDSYQTSNDSCMSIAFYRNWWTMDQVYHDEWCGVMECSCMSPRWLKASQVLGCMMCWWQSITPPHWLSIGRHANTRMTSTTSHAFSRWVMHCTMDWCESRMWSRDWSTAMPTK